MSGIPQSGRIPIRLPRADVMACGKALQKTFSASQLEDVTLEFMSGQLTISSKWGGTIMPYEGDFEGTLVLHGGNFRKLISANTRSVNKGAWIECRVDMVLKEYAMGNAGVKCRFL
jgi:hypothetical protein